MADRYAIVDTATREVTNVVSWDGVSSWRAPAGHELFRQDNASIGDSIAADGRLTKKVVPLPRDYELPDTRINALILALLEQGQLDEAAIDQIILSPE